MALHSSTPLSTRMSDAVQKLTDEDISRLSSAARHTVKSTTMLEHVCEAIKTIGVPRKGASLYAIKKFICDIKGNDVRTIGLIKKAILKGLELGSIARGKGCESTFGVNGSFVLSNVAGTKAKKPSKTKTQNKPSSAKPQKSKDNVSAGKKSKLPLKVKLFSNEKESAASIPKNKGTKSSKTAASKDKKHLEVPPKTKQNRKPKVPETNQENVDYDDETKTNTIRKGPSKAKDAKSKLPKKLNPKEVKNAISIPKDKTKKPTKTAESKVKPVEKYLGNPSKPTSNKRLQVAETNQEDTDAVSKAEAVNKGPSNTRNLKSSKAAETKSKLKENAKNQKTSLKVKATENTKTTKKNAEIDAESENNVPNLNAAQKTKAEPRDKRNFKKLTSAESVEEPDLNKTFPNEKDEVVPEAKKKLKNFLNKNAEIPAELDSNVPNFKKAPKTRVVAKVKKGIKKFPSAESLTVRSLNETFDLEQKEIVTEKKFKKAAKKNTEVLAELDNNVPNSKRTKSTKEEFKGKKNLKKFQSAESFLVLNFTESFTDRQDNNLEDTI